MAGVKMLHPSPPQPPPSSYPPPPQSIAFINCEKSAYQPTKVDMATLRAGKSDTTSSRTSSYDSPEVVKGGYKPIGKVDIAAIRAQAKQAAEYQQQSRQAQSPPASPTRERESTTYVGTSGYTPVSLPKPRPLVTPTSFQNEPPKPVAPRFRAGSTPRFGAGSGSGTLAPMPVAPKRESQALGGASKNFTADASGKTPSQLWAERKARERGLSASEVQVIPDVSPATPLPTSPGRRDETPPGGYVEDSSEVIGKPVSGGVAAMRERFARQSISAEGEPPALPISPTGVRGPPAAPRRPDVSAPAPSPPSTPSAPAAPVPPPVALSSKPPPKTYGSIDDMVAAGAGAGIGLGVGAMASHHEHEDELPEHQESSAEQTWDTRHEEPTEEEEEDLAARQRSRFVSHNEPEPEPGPEPVVSSTAGHKDAETGAESARTAIVLFDYEAQEENEIALKEGEIITEIEIVDEVPSIPRAPPSHILTPRVAGMVGRSRPLRTGGSFPLKLRRTPRISIRTRPRGPAFLCRRRRNTCASRRLLWQGDGVSTPFSRRGR